MECIGVAWSVFCGLRSSRSFRECHSWECGVLVVLITHHYFLPNVSCSLIFREHHQSYYPLIFLWFHYNDCFISDLILPSLSIIPNSFDWWSLLLLFSCDDLSTSTGKGALLFKLRSKGRHSALYWFCCPVAVPLTYQKHRLLTKPF